MAAPDLVWYDDADVAVAETFFVAPEGGTPTAATQFNLWNDKGSVLVSDTATEVRVTALSRDDGGTTWSAEDELAASGMIEARAVGSAGTGIVAQTTAWTPIGRGRFLYLNDIPIDCKREIEVRISAIAGIGSVAKEVLVRATALGATEVLEQGHEESGAVGVVHGIGDGRFTALLEGGAITANGTPDDKVDITTIVYAHAGIPKSILGHEKTINGTDGAAAALTAGNAYWDTLSLGAAGTITETKSAQATAPLSTATRPAVPAGEIFLGYIEREFDATIESGDIYQDDKAYGWFNYESSGLNVTLHGGQFMADSKLTTWSRPTSLGALTASTTNYIWGITTGNGSFTITTTSARPTDRAFLLWALTTDGSGVTAAVRKMTFTGRPMVPVICDVAGTLTASTNFYRNWPAIGKGYLMPLIGISASLGGAGATSGSTIVDIATSEAGGAWTTIFTSSGTNDQRPTIAFAAGDPYDGGARPEVFTVPALGRLRFTVSAIPGTASTDLSVVALIVPVE